MPKILIKEFDKTSAGTPGRYGNYSVLITGYQKEFSETEVEAAKEEIEAYVEAVEKGQKPTPLSDTAKMVQARDQRIDGNGVYEFSSASDFLATIGETDIEKTDSTGKTVEIHYGNRMAYHLLQLGYTVIYKTISSVQEMLSEDFWSIFKDKASYDFRFVNHGLLETCYNANEYAKMTARLDELKSYVIKLADLKKDVDVNLAATEGWKDLSEEAKAEARDEAYADAFEAAKDAGYFVSLADEQDPSKNVYYAYNVAVELFTIPEGEEMAPGVKAQVEDIDKYDAEHLTPIAFNTINGCIAKLASYKVKEDDGTVLCDGRGDCTALVELAENDYVKASTKRPEELIIDGIDKMTGVTKNEGPYCALTVPSVYYKTAAGALKFPAAFHYLACFMNSLGSGYAEWYAAAGYTRGVSSYVIDHTSVKLGEIAINALEPRNIDNDPLTAQPKFACNVIANFRGSYYLWGNRTAAELKAEMGGGDLTAEHFLNIRQLCTTIKKQLYVACRRFTFDPNSDTLWFNFVNAITPTLDMMKADQGIRDYKVVKVFTDKKATMKAKIRIIPIEAVEDFDLEISLEDSFGETTATVNG